MPRSADATGPSRAAGMLASHYAPRARVVLAPDARHADGAGGHVRARGRAGRRRRPRRRPRRLRAAAVRRPAGRRRRRRRPRRRRRSRRRAASATPSATASPRPPRHPLTSIRVFAAAECLLREGPAADTPAAANTRIRTSGRPRVLRSATQASRTVSRSGTGRPSRLASVRATVLAPASGTGRGGTSSRTARRGRRRAGTADRRRAPRRATWRRSAAPRRPRPAGPRW